MTSAVTSSNSSAFYVSSGNLDAVDFTGVGLLAIAFKDASCTAFVDSSVTGPNDINVRRFDPRLAVPSAEYSISPDRSVRQLVYPLSTHSEAAIPDESLLPMPGRFADLLYRSIKTADTLRDLPAEFLRTCYREVGADTVVVRTRDSRHLSRQVRHRVIDHIEHQTKICGPGVHKFRQGGGAVLQGESGESISSSVRWT